MLCNVSVYHSFDLLFQFHRNYSALSNFKGYLDPDFISSINPFWLQFPPPTSQQHYFIGAIHIILMIIGCFGNAFVLFMFAK